jgi:hypothetical protein
MSSDAAPSWARVVAGPFVARRSALLTRWDGGGALVLVGGRTDSGAALGDAWLLNTTSSQWRQLASLTVGRFSFVGGVDEASAALLVFGGELGDGAVVNELWRLPLDGGSAWTRLSAGGASPQPRYGHAGGVARLGGASVLVATHGFDKSTRWSDSFLYNVTSNAWSDVTPRAGPVPSPRCLVAGATMQAAPDSRVLVGMMGGCGSGGYGPCPSDEMWALALSTTSSGATIPAAAAVVSSAWTQQPSCLRARVWGSMAALQNGSFVVFGGSGGPLVAQDVPGQLNWLAALEGGGEAAWQQQAFGGAPAPPSQPGGSAQSALASSPDGRLWVQLGGSNELWRIAQPGGAAAAGGLPQCYASPVPAWRAAHGVLMGLSWGFLLPVGLLVARFGKHKDPLWFKVHRGVQISGLLLALLGFIIAVLMVATGHFLARPHAYIGLVAMALGMQQPFNAWLRPHKTKGAPRSVKRTWWERWHKYSGRSAVALGLLNPFFGISYLHSTAGLVIYSTWVALYLAVLLYLTAHGLPWKANGPSWLAQQLNRRLCCCLEPWDDSLRPRGSAGEQQLLQQQAELQLQEQPRPEASAGREIAPAGALELARAD